MKNITLKAMVTALFLAFGGGLLAAADNPVIGNWTLNVAKSSFNPAPALKSGSRTYVESPEGITVTMSSVDESGMEAKNSVTYKEDGQPHPASGNDSYDAVVVTKVDRLHARILQTKKGKTMYIVTRAVSEDGKTLTIIAKGIDSKGVKFDDKLVYERD